MTDRPPLSVVSEKSEPPELDAVVQRLRGQLQSAVTDLQSCREDRARELQRRISDLLILVGREGELEVDDRPATPDKPVSDGFWARAFENGGLPFSLEVDGTETEGRFES